MGSGSAGCRSGKASAAEDDGSWGGGGVVEVEVVVVVVGWDTSALCGLVV